MYRYHIVTALRSANMSVKVLSILCVSVLISAVIGDSLLTPCKTDDVECLSKTTSQFLYNTCKGIPDYGIQAIDPLIISSIDYEAPGESGIILHFKNLNVTGLKDQQFSDFKMDTEKHEVVLTTKANINVDGEATVEFSKASKPFEGTFTVSGSVAGTATYSYSFKKDDKDVTHYEVGPEKITCHVLGEPKLTLGNQLEDAFNAEPEKLEQATTSFIKKEVLCHFTKKAYVTVIHNIRAAAKILPTTSFLIGV